ncbi:hypothetical protein [Bremerella sp.]|uniref:hypothetical protein n=1 Tax=Bremerella sp. TaxID=2795602 RepID=UPI003919EC6D
MLELLRKTAVITAIFALLLPSFCLAASGNCACGEGTTSAAVCQCCCEAVTSTPPAGCPHCRTKFKSAPIDGESSVHADSICHCEVTAPLPSVSLFNVDAATTDGLVALALEADLAPYVAVCSRDRQLKEDGNSLPLPEPRFRQIVLCVWLT